jgi:hypothetical protein
MQIYVSKGEDQNKRNKHGLLWICKRGYNLKNDEYVKELFYLLYPKRSCT